MDDNRTTTFLDEKHKTLKVANINHVKIVAYMNELWKAEYWFKPIFSLNFAHKFIDFSQSTWFQKFLILSYYHPSHYIYYGVCNGSYYCAHSTLQNL